MTAAAENHLADAKRARKAAETVVAAHKAELQKMKQDYAKGQLDQDAYEERLEDAKYDRDRLLTARDALNDQIYALDRELDNQGTNEKTEKLQRLRDELLVERDRLDEQLSDLTNDISSAEAYG